jgi:phage shock protein A
MGILGRLSSLVKSNVNDVIDRMQDPAKEIDLMVRD